MWILPTSHDDASNGWLNETNAYDGTLATQSSSMFIGWTEKFLTLSHAGVTSCSKIRVCIVPSTAGQEINVTVEVEYGAAWYELHNGVWSYGDQIKELAVGSSQTLTGIRIKTNSGSNKASIYEAQFNQASGAAPTIAAIGNPPDEDPDTDLTDTLRWAAGAPLDVDSYNVYFGTDDPPTNIVNGDNQYPMAGGIDIHDPSGLDPETEYFWRIDSVNDYGTTTGTQWDFTTRARYKSAVPGTIPF